MSGHSKWSQIVRQKEANDLKKGQVHTKVAKQIVLAARQSGGDPETNFSLKVAISRAKSVSMSSDNIERAIKKGLGEDKTGVKMEYVSYEAYGIGGATLIIDAITDNRNRSAADLRMLIEKNGGRMVDAGALSWQYETKGLLTLYTETEIQKNSRINRKWNDTTQTKRIPTDMAAIEAFEMQAIDIANILDVIVSQDEDRYMIQIYTNPEELDTVKRAIIEMDLDIDGMALIKQATTTVVLPDDALEKNSKLIDVLEENDDVDTIWTNIA